MKLLFAFFISIFASLFFVPVSDAAQTTACRPVFGGGETCRTSDQIGINKKVLNPASPVAPNQKFTAEQFIENVDRTGRMYGPNQPVAFRLEVTNLTNKTLEDITVTDYIPVQHVTFMTGDGTYDRQKQIFTSKIESLKANETKVLTVQLMSARVEDLQRNNNSLCTLNRADARVGNEMSEDNAVVCVSGGATNTVQNQQSGQNNTPSSNPTQTRGGTPVFPQNSANTRQTPETGPELLGLAALLPLGATGLYLRRKTF